MAVINRVPELLAEKFGGADKIVVQTVAYDVRMPYSTVERWVNGEVTRIDLPILDKWCNYLKKPVGEILVHVPDEQ